MPNFKCKDIKELILPYEKNGVCFEWVAQNADTRLIYTHFKEANFFLQISYKKDEFIIKGEKHSKPEKIGYLQKALLVFKECFCDKIINEALALKHTRILSENAYIQKDRRGLLKRIAGYKEIYVEIGFGSGRHLLYQAKNNPYVLIIGIEIYTPAIEQVAKLAMRANLNNIVLIKSDARLLLSILPSNVLSKIFLHFPVPWDKQIHKRVVSVSFAKECLRVLKPNGRFELRTDSKEYFEFSKQIFSALPNIQIQSAKNEHLNILSKYETRWKKQEKDMYDLFITCKHLSESLSEGLDFKSESLSLSVDQLACIKRDFTQRYFRGEDFFIRLENLYTINDDNSVLKFVFGAFYKNEHGYLLLNKSPQFLFQEPFNTKENLKALEKLSEFLR